MSNIMTSLQQYAPVILAATWRGALVLVLAALISAMLRNRPAAVRHMVWTVAVAAQLALPLLAQWGPHWHVPLPDAVATMLPPSTIDASVTPGALPRAPSVTAPATPNAAATSVETSAGSTSSPTTETIDRTPSKSVRHISRSELLAWVWLAGAVVILARLAIGTVAVAGFARRGTRVVDGNWLSLAQQLSGALGITRPLTLMRGTRVGVPITWGILYPIVMLPEDADNWPEDRRRFVLVHEMAHIKRFDALTQLLGQLALTLFWFNPLVWIANRRMQLEREHACDDYVMRHGTPPSQYAEELLSMVRALGTPSHRNAQPAFAALAMARRSEFEGRMLSILDPQLDRHAIGKGRAFMGTIVAIAIILPLAALQPYQSVVADSRPATATRHTEAGTVAPNTTSGSATSRVAPPAETAALPGDNGRTPAATNGSATSASNVAAGCDDRDWKRSGGVGTSIHTHNDDDGDRSPVFTYLKTSAARCTTVSIHGRITWTEQEDDVLRMPLGSIATFRERTPSLDRELFLSSANNGAINRIYRVNGDERSYDDDARRWFAAFLPVLLSEAGINVEPRVARWRRDGGVSGALTQIAEISSTGAKRAHYEALLKDERLSTSDLDRIVRQAGDELKESSGDLRAVLSQVAPSRRGVGSSLQSSDALEHAVAGIMSSGDRTEVLMLYGQSANRDMLLMIARLAAGIESSGDRARLLMSLAPRYHEGADRKLYEAFYSTARRVPSSGDMRNVLVSAIPFAARSAGATLALIDASREVASSGDRAEVMIAIARAGALRDSALREAFFSAADGISSDGDRSRVLRAASRE